MNKVCPPKFNEPKQNSPTNTIPTDEERMRILANYIIDRMLEDYKKGLLKIPPKQAIFIDRVIAMRYASSNE